MNRRQFLIGGIAIAATASLGITGWQSGQAAAGHERQWVLAAILPALLHGALPDDATLAQLALTRTQTAVEDFLPFLPLRQQQELDQLFSLLANRLTQLALSGHITALDTLSVAQRLDMLAQWRDSYLTLLQQAYHGLRELLFGAYYGQPDHWQALQYQAPAFH